MNTTSQLFRRLALLLGATTFLFSAWAQNQATLTPIGKWPEYPLLRDPVAVRVAGSHAYLAGAGYPYPLTGAAVTNPLRLLTLDVSTPSRPQYVGCLDGPTNCPVWSTTSMEIRGNYAYVAIGSEGGDLSGPGLLAVYSLSQPAAPQLLGTWSFTGWASDLDVVGDYVYVPILTGLGSRVQVINVSDPVHPKPQTSVYPPGFTYCLSVAGKYAYSGGGGPGGRVNIIDVSSPGRPVVAGGFDIPEEPRWVSAIAAQGSLLHLAYPGNPSIPYEVYDLSDPVHPARLSRYEVAPLGYSYLLRVAGDLVYLQTGAALYIFDLTDPSNPQPIGFSRLGPPGDMSHSVEVVGQTVYGCASGGELKIIDVSEPTAPIQVGHFDTAFDRLMPCAEGGLVYVLEAGRFRIIDVSNPRVPKLVGAKYDLGAELPDANFGVSDFRVVGPRAYVGGTVGRRDGGVSVSSGFLTSLDVSDPTHPRELGLLETFAPGAGVDVVGTCAYVVGTHTEYSAWAGASAENRLAVIDVSNPAAMSELGYLVLPDWPSSPQVVGDIAYYRLYNTDLVAVNIHDPTSMFEAGRYHPTNYQVGAFQVVGQYAYAIVGTSAESSLHIVSFADPAHPQRVGRYIWEGETLAPEELWVQGKYAFVALSGATNRLDILDVGDRTNPLKVAEYRPGRSVMGMAMVGNTLYLTSDAGLTVLDFFAPNTSPNLRLNAPVLSGGVAVLTWEGGPGIKLQKTTSLSAPDWKDVPNTDGQSVFALPPTDSTAFFRLVQP